MTEKAKEPTAKAQTLQSTPADAAILALQQQVAELTARLANQAVVDDKPGDEAQPEHVPGEYYEDGRDPATGQPRIRKRRWSRALIDQRYEKVTFTPMLTTTVRPHGITKGGYELTMGQPIAVPSIVKTIHDDQVLAIRRQSEGYPGASQEQERAIFEAARKDATHGRHATPLQHVGFGWSESALRAASAGTIDPTHEPEQGFPGGYKGEPLPEKTI